MTNLPTPAAEPAQRDSIDLTGLWRFAPDAFGDGERQGYAAVEVDTRRWREVHVPCTFDDCLPQLAAYEGKGWFRREIDLPADWLGRHLSLRFEGVNYDAQVWVNGQLAGMHQGGFLRFDLPLNGMLVAGRNAIAVCADNTRRHGEVPGKQRGWRPYGGILREVALDACPMVHIEQPVIVAQADGTFRARLIVQNDMPATPVLSATLNIMDAQGQIVASVQTEPQAVPAQGQVSFSLSGQVPNVTPWSPDQPVLYRAVFSIAGDALEVQTGFRTFARQGTQLMLNGQPLRLQGFNRHEDSPHAGPLPDSALLERDLRHIKQLGANFVRLCHYPHHPLELALCDQLGLLVMSEIPLYWWNGSADGDQPAEVKLAAAKRQLEEMIARDANHPAIMFWSVSNETHEQRPEVSAGNAALIAHARELDPARLAVHVSDHWPTAPHFEQDDVICLNAYPTWSGRGWQSNPQYDVAESTRWWDEHLATLHAQYPQKPILITEFGYPALWAVFDNALGEDMQARQLESEAAAFDKPYVCGMTIWCYADHPWPEEPFINNMTNSPFGIVTRDRRPKQAIAAVRRLFHAPAPVPQPDAPENMTVNMIRPHLRDIPEVPFPEGYAVRALRRNEGGLWEDIWRDAEQFSKIENGLFEREFGDDPAAIERRCFIITAPDGVAAATISAWYSRDIDGLDYGRIHWVATRKAYQGKGIMRAGLSYALRQMAQWHTRAILGTSTGRIAAIKLYLDYGFVPDMNAPNAHEAWTSFRKKLDHPALAFLDEA
jgi:beta-galactosidase/beta-glucuronidase/GNAT superfamily N-acetyltransferase